MEDFEQTFFALVDGYTRRRYQCFIAEMFPEGVGSRYILCFRPTGVNLETEDRYACRYIKLDADEIRDISSAGEITSVLSDTLHRDLSHLADLQR